MSRYFFITSLVFTSLCGCIDCEKSVQSYKNYDLEVILTERPTINSEMNFVGTKLNSDKATTTRIMGRWYRDYKDYMEIGDTVIKRKGELILYIHKKGYCYVNILNLLSHFKNINFRDISIMCCDFE